MAGLTSTAQAAPAPAGAAASPRITTKHVCASPRAHRASCDAIKRTDATAAADTQRIASAMAAPGGVKPAAAATPSGYGPAEIQSAYKLAGASSGGRTVAIVDAYDDPTAASDLAVYRSTYGLPACGAGCFTKINQTGGTSYPATDAGWAEEISLDLDMVSATCPDCKILLVEANSSSLTDLGAAVNTAARPGVVAISNSYGGGDLPDSSYGHYYNH